MNAKSDGDEFTSLHMSVFRGHYDLTKQLVSYGADITCANHDGLNLLHCAAQGDQPLMIYYLLREDTDLDINTADCRGSTSLHWAAYSKSELSLNCLLAWGAQTEVYDGKEMTPLHLAVKQVDSMKTNRMV